MIFCITATGKVTEVMSRDLIEDFISQFSGKNLILDDEEADLLSQIASADIPVYDLTRGLYPYVPLEGSESHAEAVSSSGTGDDNPATGETPTIDLSGLGLTAHQQGEIEKRIMSTIRVREQFSASYTNGVRERQQDENEEAVAAEVFSTDGKTKYYKSKTGKLRKAGKSKARPGETETWLTDEQYAAVS